MVKGREYTPLEELGVLHPLLCIDGLSERIGCMRSEDVENNMQFSSYIGIVRVLWLVSKSGVKLTLSCWKMAKVHNLQQSPTLSTSELKCWLDYNILVVIMVDIVSLKSCAEVETCCVLSSICKVLSHDMCCR
jgi:hypothetical protein